MFKNYIKTAFRNIVRNKFISFINIGGLGFGIAIFLIIIFYVLHELNHDKFNQNYENIYRLDLITENQLALSPGMVGELLTNEFPEIKSFNRMDSYRDYVVKYENNILEVKNLLLADSSFFDMFSYELIKGTKQDLLNRPYTIVLNETTVSKIFGDKDPVGQRLLFNNKFDFEVTGVIKDMPDNSHIQANAIISIENLKKFRNDEELFNHLGMWNYYTYFLVNEGTNKEVLEEKITDHLRTYFSKFTNEASEINFTLVPLKDIYFTNSRAYEYESGNRAQLKVFIAVGIIILLIAIINYVNLTVAQLYNRSKELGIRKVIGAKKKIVFFQLIIESIVFSVIAINLSLVFIEILKPIFNDYLNIQIKIGYFENPMLILYFLSGGILIGILSGIFPALHVAGINSVKAMSKEITHGKTGILIRKSLIIIQYIIASSLVIATFIVLIQMRYIQKKDLGFDKEQLIYLKMNSDIRKKQDAFKDELLKRTDIKNVSYSYGSYRVESEHWSNNDGEKSYACHIEFGDKDYLETLGIELIEGRNLSGNVKTDEDKFLINETAAREIFNGNAIGEKIFDGEVIGVVKDYSFETLHKNIEPLAILLETNYSSMINIRIDSDNWTKVMNEIDGIWKDFSPNFPLEFNFVDKYLQAKYKKEIEFSRLFILFSIISILIACLGIIGLISFTIQRKSKEIGIRKVNGANAFRIILMLSSELNTLVIWSNVIAIPVTWYLMSKWLQGFAFHTELPYWVFIISFLIVLTITFIAISYQSYRASKLNPVDALRYE